MFSTNWIVLNSIVHINAYLGEPGTAGVLGYRASAS